MMFSMNALGSGLGPLLAGMTFDLTGSYSTFLLIGTIGCFFSGLLILTLPRYPVWRHAEPELAAT
jgi:hypothetical protein